MSAILILFEMTDDYRIILPLMLATVISTFVAERMFADSIYTLKLRRRGVRLSQGRDEDVMQTVRVSEVMDTQADSVVSTLSIPARAFDTKPQPDHNELTDEPQFAAIENRHSTNSAARPQSDHIQTHKFHANSMPMSGYAVLAGVVAAWPNLSAHQQQHVLAEFPVNQDQVGPDVTVPRFVPLVRQRMVAVPRAERPIIDERFPVPLPERYAARRGSGPTARACSPA